MSFFNFFSTFSIFLYFFSIFFRHFYHFSLFAFVRFFVLLSRLLLLFFSLSSSVLSSALICFPLPASCPSLRKDPSLSFFFVFSSFYYYYYHFKYSQSFQFFFLQNFNYFLLGSPPSSPYISHVENPLVLSAAKWVSSFDLLSFFPFLNTISFLNFFLFPFEYHFLIIF